jgi:putative heme uptake system protein
MDDAGRRSYLLIDGENLDATLGTQILGRRPMPEERPRWNRVLEHVEQRWQQPVQGLFFLAVAGEMPMGFVQAVMSIGYRPVPLQGEGKVVDIAIQRTLAALAERDDDVVLASHDGDFLDDLGRLCGGDRRVGLLGFSEFYNAGFRELPGLELIDLEYDVKAFTTPLPRVRVIPIDEFDPLDFL